MDSEVDPRDISPEALGITEKRQNTLLVMLQTEGYIKGIKDSCYEVGDFVQPTRRWFDRGIPREMQENWTPAEQLYGGNRSAMGGFLMPGFRTVQLWAVLFLYPKSPLRYSGVKQRTDNSGQNREKTMNLKGGKS